MATSTAVSVDVLGDVVQERARAEAREVATMLDYRDAELARAAVLESPMRRLVERSAIVMRRPIVIDIYRDPVTIEYVA